MVDLTGRQIQILRAVVEKYIETGEPVGSETLDKKFNFGVSPATIRNEMVSLQKQGYLRKAHTSSGRVPTSLAIKFYVRELMRERAMTVADEVWMKERIWPMRQDVDDLLPTAAKAIADRSQCIGIVIDQSERHIYHSGYAHLLSFNEFTNIDVMRTVLQLIEQQRELQEIIEFGNTSEPVQLVLGEELGNQYLESVGFMFSDLTKDGRRVSVGIVGPARVDYAGLIPMIRYCRDLLTDLLPSSSE